MKRNPSRSGTRSLADKLGDPRARPLRPQTTLAGALPHRSAGPHRSIFDFSAENVKVADCLAEQDEFEPSVPIVQSLDEPSNSPGYIQKTAGVAAGH